MQRPTRSRSSNASASTLDDKRGVAPTSLTSIHPLRYEINTRDRNGCHAPPNGDYLRTRNRLTLECGTLHLSVTVYTVLTYASKSIVMSLTIAL